MLGGDNANSLVLDVSYGGRRIILPGLLSWCTPQWLVVSCGRDASLAEIAKTAEAARCQILSTSDCGAVSVAIDQSGLEVRSHIAPAPGHGRRR